VGFIDADNYVPGAVHEYVKVFAAGLHLAPTPYAMVRISWQSKPKIEDGRLVFNRWGRTTHVTNRFLNLLLSTYNGFGTEVIRTGNAGEHAMTLELAKRLRFAGGFAVEPYEFLDLFEQFGGVDPSPHPEVTDPRRRLPGRDPQPSLPRGQGRRPRRRDAPRVGSGTAPPPTPGWPTPGTGTPARAEPGVRAGRRSSCPV
jgi:hypothetical protein